MMNVGIAFDILDDNGVVTPGWSKVTGHVILECKMEMTRKARWVPDGHKTPEPLHSTYAGVVSLEIVGLH